MAGDWIKMRTDLYRDPKVCMIADLLMDSDSDLARYVNQHCQRDMSVTRNVTRNVTVGALVSVWGVLRHRGKRENDDLIVAGCTVSIVDDLADIPGFGDAMAAVGWIIETESGIVLPHFFEEFNVDPAEERAFRNAERQRRYRNRQSVTRNVTRNVTGGVTSNVTRNAKRNAREEKSREEKSSNTSDIERIYDAYPKKAGRAAALKAIEKALTIVDAESLLAHVVRYAEARSGADHQFTPNPATWFNQQRWTDDPSTWRTSDNGTPGRPVTTTASREAERIERNIDAIAAFVASETAGPAPMFSGGVRQGDGGTDCVKAHLRHDGTADTGVVRDVGAVPGENHQRGHTRTLFD